MARGENCNIWTSRLIVTAVALAYVNSQDISGCCDKAVGTCRSVCEKMALVFIKETIDTEEQRLQIIYKFCTPQLTDFWICMNETIQEVVSERWWGRACCGLGRATPCRQACAAGNSVRDLTPACRLSDEISLFDCITRQDSAQNCCQQTQSLRCLEACRQVTWRAGPARVETGAYERLAETCEQSPRIFQCVENNTPSTITFDSEKYLPCCLETPTESCKTACERSLSTVQNHEVMAQELELMCGAPVLQNGLWQCFLRKDSTFDKTQMIPHDVTKLFCCTKATTLHCKKLCFETYNNQQSDWRKFYAECLNTPMEMNLSECIDEVESPCSLGCAGLTYCSQLNNRPTTLFRSCTVTADLDAHLAVADQRRNNGYATVAGLRLPLKNSSQCNTEVWKNVACALHVKPCTAKGHTSQVCAEDCSRLVSSCVEWSRAPPHLTAAALCARLAPKLPSAPCVPLAEFMAPSTEPPLLSAREAVTSPCAGSPCNDSQVCIINRNCLQGGSCSRFTCVEGCPLGAGSEYIVPFGTWVRVPMSNQMCYKICRCGNKGLTNCQPLPCIDSKGCWLQDYTVGHGVKYYMECNACVCVLGERVCARRACGRAALLTGLPCNCPLHHLPVRTPGRRHPNACLAKCAGATDADIEFGERNACSGAVCGRGHACLPARSVCLSRLQTACAQHVCVDVTDCSAQASSPVCDTQGRTHVNPCHLVMSGHQFAYWGHCLKGCSMKAKVCGVNGITYDSECAAWAEYVSVDYYGPCLAVGPISDAMEPKCQFDRINCPPLKAPNCLGFTAPGACCPRCGGALRILYSKKQIDRSLYGTNVSSSVMNLNNILKSLERHVTIAECALKGYLTIEMEIFVTVESILQNATDLQLSVCVLEAEKIADLINRESLLISVDLGLSALSYALTVHTYPTKGASSIAVSVVMTIFSFISVYVLR